MDKKQYQFKVTITLEKEDEYYTQDDVKEIVEDYLSLGCSYPKAMGGTSYKSCKVEPIND